MDKDQKPLETVAQAVEELNRRRVKRSEHDLPVLTCTPKFKDYVTSNLGVVKSGKGTRKACTIEMEAYTYVKG